MTARKTADIALVVLFVTTLAAPAVTSLHSAAADRAGLLAALRQPWRSLPALVEEHFTAHLAGRDTLVSWHGHIKADWLRASPSPKVWLGRDGWLFFNHAAAGGFVRPHDPAFPARLDRWADALSARRAWLADHGIRYLVVAAPDKQSVYPEFLPRLARRRGPSPLDGLLARCRRDPELCMLDLRDALRAARPAGPLYRLTDSHWTPAGVHAGYAATVDAMARWYPDLAPLPRSAFAVRPERFAGGDLARLLGLAGRLTEEAPRLERLTPARAQPVDDVIAYQPEPLLAHVRPRAWVQNDPTLPRVLLLGDSFADDAFCELLAEHCGRLVRVGSYQGQESLVERERPDVVICQFVERMLEGYVPRSPAAPRSTSTVLSGEPQATAP
jgi:hypothetical protein